MTLGGETLGGYDPTDNGGNFLAGNDGFNVFNFAADGPVGMQGVHELDRLDWANTLVFEGLDPTKTYTITLSANRGGMSYANARYTKVQIAGADTFTNESSAGVVVYGEEAVSFSTGYNTENGYVARWTDITAADGRFSVISTWDPNGGAGPFNTKGYAMAAFRLEQFTVVPNLCTGNIDCEDNNPCTTDTCNVDTGTCASESNTNPCDDGLKCTDNDTCDIDTGVCEGVDACPAEPMHLLLRWTRRDLPPPAH